MLDIYQHINIIYFLLKTLEIIYLIRIWNDSKKSHSILHTNKLKIFAYVYILYIDSSFLYKFC